MSRVCVWVPEIILFMQKFGVLYGVTGKTGIGWGGVMGRGIAGGMGGEVMGRITGRYAHSIRIFWLPRIEQLAAGGGPLLAFGVPPAAVQRALDPAGFISIMPRGKFGQVIVCGR